MSSRIPSLLVPALFSCVSSVSLLASTAVVKPESVGFSAERLQRIGEVMQRHIDAGNLAGAITVVARNGQVAQFQTHGVMDLESKKPMARDGVFRMASMTKPVIGVAVMMLVEEGRIRLNDPVSRFIPEFKALKVAVAKPANEAGAATAAGVTEIPFATVPANREITVRDLLSHVSGLVSGPISAQEAAKDPRKPTDDLASYVPRLAAHPLEFQPGTQWRYSPGAGFDTLGRIIEIASGQSLDQFFQKRIFDPLGMKDTFFGPPQGRESRVVSNYNKTARGLVKQPPPQFPAVLRYFSGAGGLSSTAQDYLQFALMLANGGELRGKRLLSPRAVELMSSVHIPASLPGGRGPGSSFGLSVRVISDSGAGTMMISNGSFGWGGAYGTHFWVDPKKKLVGLLMVQLQPFADLRLEFENAVMQALVE